MASKKTPSKTITVYAEILQETTDGLLARCDDEADGVWLPKSQIKYDGRSGDKGVEIRIPGWLAEEKGFIDGMGKVSTPDPTPAELETVTLYGSVMNYREVEGGTAESIVFAIGYEDEKGEYCETQHVIPAEHVLSKEFNEDDVGSIIMTRARAVELGLVQPSENADVSKPVWICEDTITIGKPLTMEEKAQYGQEMADARGEYNRLDLEFKGIKKNYDRLKDEQEATIDQLSKIVCEGKETQEVECDKLADMATEEYVWTRRMSPHEEVFRRKMTPEEKRKPLPLPMDRPKHEEAALDDAESSDTPEQARSCGTCAHAHETPDGDGQGPCENCGSDDLPNYTSAIPAEAEALQ